MKKVEISVESLNELLNELTHLRKQVVELQARGTQLEFSRRDLRARGLELSAWTVWLEGRIRFLEKSHGQ